VSLAAAGSQSDLETYGHGGHFVVSKHLRLVCNHANFLGRFERLYELHSNSLHA